MSHIQNNGNMNDKFEMIKRLESLSMLSLGEKEREELAPELEKLIGMIDKLQEVDTTNVEPLESINEENQTLREDKAENQLSTFQALQNTSNKQDNYFTVPKVIK